MTIEARRAENLKDLEARCDMAARERLIWGEHAEPHPTTVAEFEAWLDQIAAPATTPAAIDDFELDPA